MSPRNIINFFRTFLKTYSFSGMVKVLRSSHNNAPFHWIIAVCQLLNRKGFVALTIRSLLHFLISFVSKTENFNKKDFLRGN